MFTLAALVRFAARVNPYVLDEAIFFVENFFTMTTRKKSTSIVKDSNVSHQTFTMSKHSTALKTKSNINTRPRAVARVGQEGRPPWARV